MIPYWILYAIPTAFALVTGPLDRRVGGHQRFWVLGYGVVIALMIGFRWNVGGDWGWEHHFFKLLQYADFDYAWSIIDPFYGVLIWLLADTGYNVWTLNLATGIIFAAGLVKLCRNEPHPWLAVAISIPYLVMVVGMGYARQSAALGVFMYALVALRNQRVGHYIALVLLAATMHKTAVLLLPLAILGSRVNKIVALLAVAPVFAAAFLYLVNDHVDNLVQSYIVAKYSSSGTLIRLTMNLVAALTYFLFRHRFQLTPIDRSILLTLSVVSILSIPLYWLIPSSTAVDRYALYCIPLQILVFGRLPLALGRDAGSYRAVVGLVLSCYGAALLTWLNYADTAYAWIPYRVFPSEFLTGLEAGPD